MPDDQLFDTGQSTNQIPDPSAPQPGGEDKGEGGPSLEAIQDQLTQMGEGTNATNQQLQETVVSLQNQLANMQQAQLMQQQQAQAQQPPPDPSDRFQQLYQDPDGYINKHAQVAALQTMQKLGPHLKLQAEQSRDILVDQQKADIDGEYGEGTWSELFDEGFKKVIENMPLEMQSSKDHVDSAVSAILGSMVRNPETLGKLQEKRAEVKKRVQAPSMMYGVRQVNRGSALNEEEKEFLASLARSGMPMDPKEYLQFRDTGDSEDQWLGLKDSADVG